MRITIINGFFLPVPPVRGGSTEKTWYQLAQEFAARGQKVTCISRHWPGFPDDEIVNGIRHLRLPGHDHTDSRWWNLVHDFLWSRRVLRSLPPGDIVVCNAVTLPVWLGRSRPAAEPEWWSCAAACPRASTVTIIISRGFSLPVRSCANA